MKKYESDIRGAGVKKYSLNGATSQSVVI